MLKQTML